MKNDIETRNIIEQKLKALFQHGVLTEKEFNIKIKNLLTSKNMQ